jgi:hypothetical protein
MSNRVSSVRSGVQDHPIYFDSGEAIEDAASLDEDPPVFQGATAGRLEDLGEHLLAQELEHETPAGGESPPGVFENSGVVSFVFEISERSKEIHDEVECFRAFEFAHVGFDPLYVDARGRSALARLREHERAFVDAGHAESAFWQLDCCPARAATQIERSLGSETDGVEESRNFFTGLVHTRRRKHEVERVLPELITSEPIGHRGSAVLPIAKV